MPASVTLDVWLNGRQSLTRGYGVAPGTRDAGARPVLIDGLTNDEGACEEALDAINTALEAEGSDSFPFINHPADTDLPVRDVTVMRSRGGEKALGVIRYGRTFSRVDLSVDADAQSTRRGGQWSFSWYRDGNAKDSEGRPNGNITFDPRSDALPVSQKVPRAYSWTFGVVHMTIHTIVSSRPAISYNANSFLVNHASDGQWTTAGAFPAGTLLYQPYVEQYLQGGQYYLQWSALYNPHKWYRMLAPVYNTTSNEWETSLELAFPETTSLLTYPVHA